MKLRYHFYSGTFIQYLSLHQREQNKKLKAHNLYCKYFLVLVCQYVNKTINFAKISQVTLSESGKHYTFCLYPIKQDKET